MHLDMSYLSNQILKDWGREVRLQSGGKGGVMGGLKIFLQSLKEEIKQNPHKLESNLS